VHNENYQIQPASESDVRALKQQIEELTARLTRMELFLNMPMMETKNAEKPQKYTFTEDEIKRGVERAQTSRRHK